MFKSTFQELRVGRIPTGYAALEAEAMEFNTTTSLAVDVAEDLGTMALEAAYQTGADMDAAASSN
jgi:hypothetical protein